MDGSFSATRNGISTLGSISVAVRSNSVCNVVNVDNTKGDALIQYVGVLRGPASNRIAIGNGELSAVSPTRLHTTHHGVAVVFRRFGLLVRHGYLGGIYFPVRLTKTDGGSTRGHTGRLLTLIKLPSGTGTCPTRLSNNRRRHVTVTETLTAGPGILLYSRTADTLSPGAAERVLRLVHSVGGGLNVAIMVVARRVDIIGRIYGRITVLSSNVVTRRNLISSMFASPGSRTTHRLMFPNNRSVAMSSPLRREHLGLAFLGMTTASMPLITELTARRNVDTGMVSTAARGLSSRVCNDVLLNVPGDRFSGTATFLGGFRGVGIRRIDTSS